MFPLVVYYQVATLQPGFTSVLLPCDVCLLQGTAEAPPPPKHPLLPYYNAPLTELQSLSLILGSELEASVPGCAAGLFVAAGGGGAQDFGGSWRLGQGVFGAVLLYAGLGEVDSVSLAKFEDGCSAGTVSGGSQFGLGKGS